MKNPKCFAEKNCTLIYEIVIFFKKWSKCSLISTVDDRRFWAFNQKYWNFNDKQGTQNRSVAVTNEKF